MDRCDNAERAVRKALLASDKLRPLRIDVFVQGSYANGTNVRQDSDVDVCVLYREAWFSDYRQATDLSNAVFGYVDGTYPYATFKNDVEAAMVSYFGQRSVQRGKKAIDIRENTYRVDADVVACFEHRLYGGDRSCNWYESGTQLIPDDGGQIINWPKQNKDNGVAKDGRVYGEFKAVTRVLKNLRFEMLDAGEDIANKIASYLIECLVYKVPDDQFRYGDRYGSVRNAIVWLWEQTATDAACALWTEVNEIKYLFHSSQPWNRADVRTFLQTAWTYIGFQ